MAVQKHLPRELKSAQTQKKIIDTSIKILSEYDFKYLTVRNICEEAQVAYGSFYHHFQTKENVLLFCGKQLLEMNIQSNPLPSSIDANDYVHVCIWYGIIISRFCQYLGKDFIKTIFLNSEGTEDMFDGIYNDFLFPSISGAGENGYITYNSAVRTLEERINILKKDLTILIRGTILWWCCSQEGGQIEPFEQTMEHLIFHVLHTTQSEQAAKKFDNPLRMHETSECQNIQLHTFADLIEE